MNQPTNVYCDQNQICQDCLNTDCLYCKSDLNTCTQCVSKFLFNGICSNDQPTGTFCDKSTKICTKCSVDSCNQCLDDIQICQKCDQSSTKPYLYQNSCLNSTPDYVQCDSQNICTNKPPTYCTENCQTCDYKQKICLQCSNTYLKVISQSSSLPTCQSNCPSNSSQQNQECYVCPQFCTSCNSQFQCLSCQYGYSLQSGVCSLCKGLAQGSNPSSYKCEPCQVTNCQNCTVDSSKCNMCSSNYYLVNNKCQTSHPVGYFCDSQNVCFKCNGDCNTCDEQRNCNTCSDGCIQCLDSHNCTACGDDFLLDNHKCTQFKEKNMLKL
ncbi:zinc finger lsd1 subclass family protein (macronuclear) [Tetrahymena thermophila SB210]|uniref:Zinc finger lsd1 subclass family protein n=1 Tax=Tetrahymena thermophila (strain SB210) TaxID=312017 RepID=I7MDM5_TETTS|nr:zinc finger lsd1 subclass family protein [Tetrahymena thermophila SB210]EAR89887.2 zinc finger lsd1 subclass family protein [Tetrahymena thermophila SB210]|eukprot:XP_001010132.2 zinc finger lsd1 subclass family protein [Tetrahymena thermophila SB210]